MENMIHSNGVSVTGEGKNKWREKKQRWGGGGEEREKKGNASHQTVVKWEKFFELAASGGH